MDSGEIIINGKRIDIKNPRDALRVGIAYLAEDRKESLVFMRYILLCQLIITGIVIMFTLLLFDKQ